MANVFYSVTLHCLREALENYCLFIQRLPLTLKNGLCQVSQFEIPKYFLALCCGVILL